MNKKHYVHCLSRGVVFAIYEFTCTIEAARKMLELRQLGIETSASNVKHSRVEEIT